MHESHKPLCEHLPNSEVFCLWDDGYIFVVYSPLIIPKGEKILYLK
jgi:hypothetical protein